MSQMQMRCDERNLLATENCAADPGLWLADGGAACVAPAVCGAACPEAADSTVPWWPRSLLARKADGLAAGPRCPRISRLRGTGMGRRSAWRYRAPAGRVKQSPHQNATQGDVKKRLRSSAQKDEGNTRFSLVLVIPAPPTCATASTVLSKWRVHLSQLWGTWHSTLSSKYSNPSRVPKNTLTVLILSVSHRDVTFGCLVKDGLLQVFAVDQTQLTRS